MRNKDLQISLHSHDQQWM